MLLKWIPSITYLPLVEDSALSLPIHNGILGCSQRWSFLGWQGEREAGNQPFGVRDKMGELKFENRAWNRWLVGILLFGWVCVGSATALWVGPPWQAAGAGVCAIPVIVWIVSKTRRSPETEGGSETSINLFPFCVGLAGVAVGVALLCSRDARSGYMEHLATSAIIGGAILAIAGGVILLK